MVDTQILIGNEGNPIGATTRARQNYEWSGLRGYGRTLDYGRRPAPALPYWGKWRSFALGSRNCWILVLLEKKLLPSDQSVQSFCA